MPRISIGMALPIPPCGYHLTTTFTSILPLVTRDTDLIVSPWFNSVQITCTVPSSSSEALLDRMKDLRLYLGEQTVARTRRRRDRKVLQNLKMKLLLLVISE